MTDEFKQLPAKPPRGMIKIDGEWKLRRFGLLVQRELTCIYGHRIHVRGRPLEIVIPCNTHQAHCSAELYVLALPPLLWAMDLTLAEAEIIGHGLVSVQEIVEHFGVGFPTNMKLPSVALHPA